MRRIVGLFVVFLCACQTGKASDGKPAGSAAAASGVAPAAAAADDLTEVDLKPAPLSIRVPQGGMGTMDMSMGDKKSVTIDIGSGSLNIQEMVEKDVAELKHGFKVDKVLFPFKRFVKEEGNKFIVEIEPEAKTLGYIGVNVKEIGGKKWICKTTGLQGVKSADAAEKNLAFCDSLKAK